MEVKVRGTDIKVSGTEVKVSRTELKVVTKLFPDGFTTREIRLCLVLTMSLIMLCVAVCLLNEKPGTSTVDESESRTALVVLE